MPGPIELKTVEDVEIWLKTAHTVEDVDRILGPRLTGAKLETLFQEAQMQADLQLQASLLESLGSALFGDIKSKE